jgi:hypothetical protein
MKQSDLTFKENNKNCVWCEWNGIEFYWEIRSEVILLTPDSYQNIYVPVNVEAKDARSHVIRWIKDSFNV